MTQVLASAPELQLLITDH